MRSGSLDILRALAIIWMIIFHFCYDLRMFHYINWDFSQGFWFAFPRVIAFTFLFCVGVSLFFVHEGGIKWRHLKKRSLKLGGAAALISFGSYLAYPDNWVFFGTLHCILFGSFLGVFFVNHRLLSFIGLIALLTLQYILNYDIKWVSRIINRPSLDFIPIYPWFWVVLLGILMAPLFKRKSSLKAPAWMRFLSQHSLKIYLVHQPLFFAILSLIQAFG